MKVKLKVHLSGVRDGVDWPPIGSVMDVPDDEAKSLINADIAVEATKDDIEESAKRDETAETATASSESVETADKPLTTKTGPARRAATK